MNVGMESKTTEWLIIILFFACFFAFTAGEVWWLSRKRGVIAGKAFAFSFASNIFCITVGYFISIVVFFLFLATVVGGSMENVGIGGTALAAAVVCSLVFSFLVLTLAKFLLLRLFKFENIQHHLKYSAAASLIFFLVVTLIPGIIVYLIRS